MKPTIFISLILATLVLFSPTDVSAALELLEDSTPQKNTEEDDLESMVKDARKELSKEIFQNLNSVFNLSLTATDDLKRLEELQRLKAEVAEELKHLDRLRQLKVAIAEELGRLEELQRLKIKMTEDGHTNRDQKSFTPVGSWETVSIDGKPVTEHFLKAPILPFIEHLVESFFMEHLAEKIQVPIDSDEGKPVSEYLAGDIADIDAKISQNDFVFFDNGSWFWTVEFNVEADMGDGLSLLPTVGLAVKGSYYYSSFTPRGGTIVMVQEDLAIQLEPEDLWTSAGITEEDFKKEITPHWLSGKAEGKVENWEASPNGNTLTLTNANGIRQVLRQKESGSLRQKESGSKNTWVPAEEQEKLEKLLTEALPRVEVLEKRNSFDGIYKREGFVRTGKDYALLFATDTYEHWGDLRTPIADVEAIGAELKNRYGFNVDIRKNVTIKDILATLAEYKAKRYATGDQLLVYFAGRGEFDEVLQDGHIAGTESELPNKDPILSTYLSFSKLRNALDNFPCERIMLILDVDYGGTFDDKIALSLEEPKKTPSIKTQGAELLLNLEDTLKVQTRWYLSSGGKEPVQDGIVHSPFTLSLLTVLRDGAGKDDVLTIPEIARLLPEKFQAELDKLKALYPNAEIQQTPASGPFGSGKADDKAFVFISQR